MGGVVGVEDDVVDGAGFGGEGDAAEGGVVGAVAGAFFAVADEEDGEVVVLWRGGRLGLRVRGLRCLCRN